MKIRSTTLAEYKDNVTAYLRFLQDNLHLISPAGMDNKMHNDLIPHIFGQLRGTKIPMFQQQILKWQRDYIENSLQLTPLALLRETDDESQILQNSNQWVETIYLAFVESIKMKIHSTTLEEYKDNVMAYLRFLQDNVHLISPAGMDDKMHDDLIPHIFGQLRGTKTPMFQQQILKWQHDYMENSLQLTPLALVRKADNESQILQNSNQWVETIDPVDYPHRGDRHHYNHRPVGPLPRDFNGAQYFNGK
jgi:hypothetical protein